MEWLCKQSKKSLVGPFVFFVKAVHKLAEGLACRCIHYIFLAQLVLDHLRPFRLPLLYLGLDDRVQIFELLFKQMFPLLRLFVLQLQQLVALGEVIEGRLQLQAVF